MCPLCTDVIANMTVWDRIIVTPSDKAYENKESEEVTVTDVTTEEMMDTSDK